ncbi:MAG: TonB-dependent receptor [Rhizobiaceae bacterium]|nr:TonB-dependent receptor [Rhizobiaceae bacterium]
MRPPSFVLCATAALLSAGVSLAPMGARADDSGFSISVDGERIAGSGPVMNTGLPQADIQVRFDGLDVRPMLNVSTVDLRRAYRAGETVDFLASLNYPAWIARAEVLVYEAGRRASARPVGVLPVNAAGHAQWIMPADGPADYAYVLRVADAKGRFDETTPLSLSRTARDLPDHLPAEPVAAAGVGEDRTAVRNIPVFGGAVTVHGTGVAAGETVHALGEAVPVDAKGSFVVQRILPPGDHRVDVQVSDGSKHGLDFSREVNIPDSEWFYVALADLTVGKKFGSGRMVATDPGEYDGVYAKGRLAFYLKGKIKGKTLLTAAADTGEGKLGELFTGMAGKDPRSVLARIDPDSYYPVYGDDSTAVDGAPTAGKFYVRLERGDSHVMWGKYRAGITDTDLLRNDRGLYGAQGVYRTEQATSFGERKFEATAYAALPGTLPQRDVLSGTGGSAYFLSRQDISRGTETVTVVTSDPVSGRVLTRKRLVPGEDYDINHLQGIVILRQPLSSTASDGALVRDGALGDRRVDLVVNYEYTPAAGATGSYSFGAEAGGWLGEHVRVGATGMSENAGVANHTMAGVNLRLRATEGTYVDAEFATSSGPGFGRTLSTDGGLTNVEQLAGPAARAGQAWSLRGELDLKDLGASANGRLGVWYEEKKAGFASFERTVAADQRSAGATGSVTLGNTELRAGLEHYGDTTGRRDNKVALEAERRIARAWRLAFGLTYSDLATPGGPAGRTGARLDTGARLTWQPDEDTKLYAFGQLTAARWRGIDRNDRIGVGGSRKLTQKVGVDAEISTGTSGLGALAAVTYEPTADDRYYVGYRLDPDALRSGYSLDGADLGGITVGARRRYNDLVTAFAENNYDMFGRRRALTSAYGVTYTPDSRWTVGAAFEAGDVQDPNASDFQRKAVSLSGGFKDGERVSAHLKGEMRLENSEYGTRNRRSWLASGGVSTRLSDDWRLIAGANAVISNSDQSALLDGDYVAADLGFAYRPVAHDRLTALAKYQFLYDLPGPQQVTANGSALGPAQRSHVLSADVGYALTKWLTVGGKYGLRLGEVSATRQSGDFVPSGAQLAVIRADVNVLKKWDVLLDARMLRTNETRTARYGALVGLYHHLGEHMKVGAGYNFASFSDDLTDLTYDDQGVFLNVVGKF